MSETGENIQCQFQIQGLEILLQDEERIKEMEEINSSESHGKKTDFS